MTLCWTSLDGPAGQQVSVQASALGSVRMVLLEVGGISAPGTFVGQLTMWDGTAWIPVPNQGGPAARAEGLQNINELDPCQLLLGDGTVAIAGQRAQMNSRLGNVVASVTDDAGEGIGEFKLSAVNDEGGLTQILGTATTVHYDTSLHTFRVRNLALDFIQNVTMGSSGDDPTLGLLGAAPQTRQSITGATTQDQVDSLVAALVAFGLVSDDR